MFYSDCIVLQLCIAFFVSDKHDETSDVIWLSLYGF